MHLHFSWQKDVKHLAVWTQCDERTATCFTLYIHLIRYSLDIACKTIQSYGASPAIWDTTVLPATRQTLVKAPYLKSTIRTCRYSIYLPRRDGRLSWPWFTRQQAVTQSGSNRSIATRPAIESATSWCNVLIVMPPSHQLEEQVHNISLKVGDFGPALRKIAEKTAPSK